MSVVNKPYEAWWTGFRTEPHARHVSPLWSSNSTISSMSTETKPSSFGDLDPGLGSTRLLQLRYNELSTQLQQCRTRELELQNEQQKVVTAIFMNSKEYGAVDKPISPPTSAAAFPTAPASCLEDVPPPSRETLMTRLVEGKREDYRRIFVPGRGWVSKSKLQTELGVSEPELERLARPRTAPRTANEVSCERARGVWA